MPRNQSSKQYNHGSDHKPSEENGRLREDREPEPERGDERIGNAHKLRDRARNGDGDSDEDRDDESFDDGYAGYSRIYDEDLEYHAEHRQPTRDEEVEDIDDEEEEIDVDIMERLDHDDLTQMDGPDA